MEKSGKNKIAFVNFSMTWGGGEAQHLALANEVMRQGHTALIVTQANSELCKRANDVGITTETLKVSKLSFLNPIVLQHIRSMLRRQQPNAVILNSSLELKHFACATSSKHYKLIYRRGYHTLIKASAVNRYCIKRLSKLVAISEFIKHNSLKTIAPFAKDEVAIINNGISPLEDISLPDYQAKRIIAVGRLVEYKQFDILIKAMPQIIQQVPEASLWIVGEGELSTELTQLISDLHLQDNVKLKGFSDDIPSLLAQSSLFVHPAKEEAFGVVFLEAMRQYLPCISFSGHAGDEIIVQGKTGLLVDKQSPDDLAHNISSILNNSEQLEQMGKYAKERFSNHFTIEKSLNKYLALINSTQD